MFELTQSQDNSAVIKVVGVGGGGGNALEHMVAENIDGVEFICANTDAQALKNSNAKVHIQLGDNLTKGLGAGANPQIGREAAEEDRDRIREVLEGADMVFITAGMGGGTGTGAAPVFAEVAKELNILTVAVVTKPFSFEGKQRALAADEGIRRLAEHVDSLITIPNNKLLSVLGKNISLLNAFKAANNVLLGAVKGISDLITRPGLINVDFADVRTVMSEMGMAMMGTGSATGEQRARQAAEAAIASPLLEDVNFSGARGILVNITAGLDMSIGEFEEVGDVVKEFISDDATVVVGTVIDPDMTDEMRVTVIVTGLGDPNRGRQQQQQPQYAGIAKTRASESMRSDGTFDYQQYERPAVMRKQATPAMQSSAAKSNEPAIPDVDYLDIPAFLRRQEEQVES
ncbi:cell division protein FtsZ [Legionella quinlivanii]|uniref:Cell division protein FtsZ n=1 Tax=Legionella quinlivanii TaxID=45073 RepID=A0A0W0Y6J0_9GAMM|nr:cell division protein FtsZ [Legionella quinlivanii]KTD52587.1 cell division protein FtsZ [Legionella quinlivanii]MCW8449713.1 cell division protein FtsZ [Legionella quinlivanii]SEF71396.1 cell division protein FtsZ [Legionella quinlivanii DSM 21216]STY12136.1 cell division protein FtsZ [Legionella quinlivanii]